MKYLNHFNTFLNEANLEQDKATVPITYTEYRNLQNSSSITPPSQEDIEKITYLNKELDKESKNQFIPIANLGMYKYRISLNHIDKLHIITIEKMKGHLWGIVIDGPTTIYFIYPSLDRVIAEILHRYGPKIKWTKIT
jgi:hypothetical protein